jgi:hypothetical protein
VSLFRSYRGVLAAILLVALLACAYVAVWRVHREHQARRVELVMDYADFSALAKAYDYNEGLLLLDLRRAGLTSLAVAEELGSAVNSGRSALLVSGEQLLDSARLSPLSEPRLAALARAGKLPPDEVYLLVYDPLELPRYRAALARHFEARSIRVLAAPARAKSVAPTIFAIHSQIDFVDTIGLGLPERPLALARKFKLLLVPRVQNDYHYGPAEIDALLGSFKKRNRIETVVFFGLHNEVLGFPNSIDATAAALLKYGYNFGAIETYDRTQVQKGSEQLGELIPEQTTRVQAIARPELDKLDLNTIVARYLLGARERNVRVVYLRPILHPEGALSITQTNLAMVREVADGLRARGLRLGRATALRASPVPVAMVIVASLAVPTIFLLLLEAFGITSLRYSPVVYGLDVALLLGGYLTHHDLLARKIIALCGAILFATAAVVAISRAFHASTPASFAQSVRAGLLTTLTATGVALAGALVVVGLLSVPILMEEIEAFTGVKAVILVPPLLALGLYLYTRRFREDPLQLRASLLEPVHFYQVVAGVVVLAAAGLYIARSGNQSDIAPSAFELAMRSNLTALLGVRPRFKEFMIGFPLMMLLPALRLPHRRVAGWFFAPAIAVGTADIIDTFSHLHTPLLVSALRLLNGLIIGIALGVLAIAVYRALAMRAASPPA